MFRKIAFSIGFVAFFSASSAARARDGGGHHGGGWGGGHHGGGWGGGHHGGGWGGHHGGGGRRWYVCTATDRSGSGLFFLGMGRSYAEAYTRAFETCQRQNRACTITCEMQF